MSEQASIAGVYVCESQCRHALLVCIQCECQCRHALLVCMMCECQCGHALLSMCVNVTADVHCWCMLVQACIAGANISVGMHCRYV